MPPKKKAPSDTDASQVSFETALAELSEIVEAMESETLPLEDLILKFEEGSKLLKHCETVLGSAQQKIKTISLAQTESPSEDTTKDDTEEDDISLF